MSSKDRKLLIQTVGNKCYNCSRQLYEDEWDQCFIPPYNFTYLFNSNLIWCPKCSHDQSNGPLKYITDRLQDEINDNRKEINSLRDIIENLQEEIKKKE